MGDMNFLDDSGGANPKRDDATPSTSGDLSFHVPEPQAAPAAMPPKVASAESQMLGSIKNLLAKVDEPKAPEVTIAPKLPAAKLVEPVLTKAPPAAPAPPPPPLPPPPPKPVAPPPPPPPKPAEPPKPTAIKSTKPLTPQPAGRDTLRVSLISSGGGVEMSDLTVRSRLMKLIYVAVGALAVVGAVYGGLLYYKDGVEKKIAAVQQDVSAVDAKIAISEKDAKSATNLQTLMKGANDALKSHVHWTNVLDMIEQVAKPGVSFSSVTLSPGSFATSITAPDYLTIAQQILVLRADPRVKDVPFSGASNGGKGGVTIALNVTYDPKILFNDEAQPVATPTAPSASSASSSPESAPKN